MDIDDLTGMDDSGADSSDGSSVLSNIDTSQLASTATSMLMDAANNAITQAQLGAIQPGGVTSASAITGMSTAEKIMIAVALGAVILAVMHK
jgi:hypothetical protein